MQFPSPVTVVIMLCLTGALLKSRMICQLSLLAAHYNYISSTLESVAARLQKWKFRAQFEVKPLQVK